MAPTKLRVCFTLSNITDQPIMIPLVNKYVWTEILILIGSYTRSKMRLIQTQSKILVYCHTSKHAVSRDWEKEKEKQRDNEGMIRGKGAERDGTSQIETGGEC